MRIIVTGGAGFLGAYAVAALEKAGHDVFAYDIAAPGPELLTVAPSLETRLRLGSIGEPDKLLEVCRTDGIEAIVHGAARLGYEPSIADPLGFYCTNIMGFVHSCEVARVLDLNKVVLVSSNAAYHEGDGEKLVETNPPFSVTRANPAAHYGTSKMACEAIGMAYAEFHGIDFLAVRVTAIYGFGMRVPIHLKPMVENAVLGRPTRIATGGPLKRDYTHVLDCASGVVAAVDAPRRDLGAQRIFNMASGRACTGDELAEMVRRIVPGADIEIGDTLTPQEAANAKMRAPMDVSAAQRELGWSPAWEIEAGIREYAERFRDYMTATRT